MAKGKEITWTKMNLGGGGGFQKLGITEPTMRASKYGVAFYNLDFEEGQLVEFFVNGGEKLALVADPNGSRALKKPKGVKANKFWMGSRKLIKDANLKAGQNYKGKKSKVNEMDAWIFDIS